MSRLERLMRKIPGFGGYLDKKERRESDRELREALSGRLDQARVHLGGITEALSADEFKGRMTVTYRRPVYNTSYFTTVFNHIDNDFFCRYSPAIPLDFSDNAYLQNLTQILGFYAYYIIGLDYDTFAQTKP